LKYFSGGSLSSLLRYFLIEVWWDDSLYKYFIKTICLYLTNTMRNKNDKEWNRILAQDEFIPLNKL